MWKYNLIGENKMSLHLMRLVNQTNLHTTLLLSGVSVFVFNEFMFGGERQRKHEEDMRILREIANVVERLKNRA